jgi:hypothetical protein
MTTENKPPEGVMIRRNQFQEHGIPSNEPHTINDWIARRNFPKPYRLGYRTLVWSLAEIKAWMAQQRAS